VPFKRAKRHIATYAILKLYHTRPCSSMILLYLLYLCIIDLNKGSHKEKNGFHY